MSRTRSRATSSSPLLLSRWSPGSARYLQCVLPVKRETTIDELHSWWQWTNGIRNDPYVRNVTLGMENGGEFTSLKTSIRLLNTQQYDLKAWLSQGEYLFNFSGVLIPHWVSLKPVRKDVVMPEPPPKGYETYAVDSVDSTMWPSADLDTDEELATLGASLVGKLAPTAPHNNVYTSLGELRNDGLPSVPLWNLLRNKNSETLAQRLGGEHLNMEFAIKPTVSDVKKILETVKTADKLWKQYLRDSGKLVRRRMDMDPEVSTTTEVIAQPGWAFPHTTDSPHWSSIGPVTVITKTTRKRWFSAAYLYYVDKSSLDGMEGMLEKAQYLYGWKPSPSGVYNLTAWSWLLDWFTNTGDVIDNVSLYLEDPFLVRWAYIMEHITVSKQMSQTVVTNDGKSIRLEVHYEVDSKKRRRVNPFHMGFKGEALNGHQLSILAALGMTKGRNPGLM